MWLGLVTPQCWGDRDWFTCICCWLMWCLRLVNSRRQWGHWLAGALLGCGNKIMWNYWSSIHVLQMKSQRYWKYRGGKSFWAGGITLSGLCSVRADLSHRFQDCSYCSCFPGWKGVLTLKIIFSVNMIVKSWPLSIHIGKNLVLLLFISPMLVNVRCSCIGLGSNPIESSDISGGQNNLKKSIIIHHHHQINIWRSIRDFLPVCLLTCCQILEKKFTSYLTLTRPKHFPPLTWFCTDYCQIWKTSSIQAIWGHLWGKGGDYCDRPSYLTMQYRITPIPYHTMPNHITPCQTIPYHTIAYHTMPNHTLPMVSYHAITYHTMPHHTLLCHTIP